jgi:hypothetical protein
MLIQEDSISSATKASALLYLAHRFLETDFSADLTSNPNITRLVFPTADTSMEDVDPLHEVEWGNAMQQKRAALNLARQAELAVDAAATPSVSTRGAKRESPSVSATAPSTPRAAPPRFVQPKSTSRTALEPFESLEMTPSELLSGVPKVR